MIRVHPRPNANCAPACAYVAIPLGSSSAAPVMRPGPRLRQNCDRAEPAARLLPLARGLAAIGAPHSSFDEPRDGARLLPSWEQPLYPLVHPGCFSDALSAAASAASPLTRSRQANSRPLRCPFGTSRKRSGSIVSTYSLLSIDNSRLSGLSSFVICESPRVCDTIAWR